MKMFNLEEVKSNPFRPEEISYYNLTVNIPELFNKPVVIYAIDRVNLEWELEKLSKRVNALAKTIDTNIENLLK